MLLQTLKKERRVIQPLTLGLFVLLSSIFLLITYLVETATDQVNRIEVQANEQSLINVERAFIINKLGVKISDVLYIGDTIQLKNTAEDDYSAVVEDWIAFSTRKTVYDQIRYLNADGDEVVRINHNNGVTEAVSKDGLQNKKDRYYFINTMELERNQVYISRLDLNVENNAIELPIKPMLRLSTPVFSPDGELEGMVILNYAAQELLEQVAHIASSSAGDMYLLNLDGYWLYNGADHTKEWAFMYEARKDIRFSREFPDEWEIISGSGSGNLHTENGAFSYTSIVLDAELFDVGNTSGLTCDSGIFYIVSHIHNESDAGALFLQDVPRRLLRVFLDYISIYFLLSGIAFALAVLLAVNRSRKKEIKFFSEYDTLTGIFNRRAGYEKLNGMKKDASKSACRIVVCFADINGLKTVNDRLGHDVGDELIKSIADVIKDTVRGNDFVARLGGDEFLIVFENITEDIAETVWGRIVQKFKQINDEEDRAYVISVSHGIGVFNCSGSETVDEIIRQADGAMYAEKRILKKDLQVIREKAE